MADRAQQDADEGAIARGIRFLFGRSWKTNLAGIAGAGVGLEQVLTRLDEIHTAHDVLRIAGPYVGMAVVGFLAKDAGVSGTK